MSEITLIGQLNSQSFFESKEGITKNLSSLRFDAGVKEPEKSLLYLRKRSHIITINMVAHATYIVASLQEIKRRAIEKVNSRKSSEMEVNDVNASLKKKLYEFDSTLATAYTESTTEYSSGLKIGLIGYGRVGLHLVQSLIEYARLESPSDIKISTRRPETILQDLTTKGVKCVSDNREAAKNVDVLFLCCPPQELTKILYEVKRNLTGLVYSVVAGVSSNKIVEVSEYKQVFKPCYENYRKEACLDHQDWNYTSVCDALAINHFKHITCPVKTSSDNLDNSTGTSVVEINDSIIYALFICGMNICLDETLTLEDAVTLCNNVVFRNRTGFTLESILELMKSKKDEYQDEMTRGGIYQNERFLVCEVTKDVKEKMALLLYSSQEFREHFIRHYKNIFDRFCCDWTKF